MTGYGNKVWYCKEKYCIGTRNARSMNQGKLKVVKQMTRLNIDNLWVSELKWTGMVKFNSDDHYTYYCGQEPLRRNGVVLIVRKNLKCSTWVQSQKWQKDLCLRPRQTIQYHSNPTLCSINWFQRSWSWMVLSTPTRTSRINIKKNVIFII